MLFIAGFVVGGLVAAVLVHFDLKSKYEKDIAESYNKGYRNGRDVEQRAIFDYIELLNKDANASIYNTGAVKDGES